MEGTKQETHAIDLLGKMVLVKIDRPLRSKHPKYAWSYELNYGFVPDTLSPDGEELDAYIIGPDKPVDTFSGICIAVIHRTNDNDDKLIIVSDDKKFISNEEIKKSNTFSRAVFRV